ncbi:MAG: FG-GAP-like repeat-containing protein, partial [Bacteroidetes bacterium]|nr:FG-GAP-like repeat-containing protein [Bacteroidota bacterium]
MKIFSLVGLMAIFMWGNLSAQTTVAAVTPAKNALNVSAATTIQATFSAAMLASSFNDTASFIVSGMTSGRHRGTIVLSSGNTVATFTTTVAFATGEIVTVDLTSNLMNAGSAAITPLVYTFTVKTNPGSGTFAASVEYPVGLGAEDVFISDLDGDGDGDLVVAIRDDSDVDSISVLKNNGDGTFAARVVYATGNNEPGSLFVNDLDGDGDGDIVVTNHGTALVFPSVSILENNGDGTFAANVDYGTGERPTSVFMSDIDGDGDGDIVVANELDNDISILKNNGNGTFATKVDYAAGVSPIKIFMSDVDGDGDGDIAVTNKLDDDVSILMNNGDGTFSAKVDYATGDNPISVFIYDLDGDLDGDIAVECTDSVSILENNGDGTFASKVNYATGGAYGFFINDVDGDGDGDIAAVNDGTNTVSILKNHGDGTFAVKANYIIGGSLNLYFGMYISDVDGDDIADIVIVNSVSNAVFILKGLPGPSVTTENSANFAVNSATANGTVNANNASTTVRFLYGIVSGIYTDSVTAAQSPVSGLTNTPVSAVLSGLDSNTTYYFLVAASNTDGYVRGGELSFTTTGGPPSATTNAASNIGLVTATVNGSVNADDISTTVRFVYGNVSGVYTDSVTATPSPVNGTTDTPVSASLSGLSPNTTYFFRVAASNAGGYVRGGESNFTTTSSAVPTATTNAASNIGVATARANGTVNAGNASTTVRFLYGTISGVYADSVTATQSPVSGTVNTSVTGSLSPLDSNTTYYFIVAASNGNGYVRGTELSFTTDSIGSSGYALHFDGTDYVAANLVTTVTNNLTMEGWVKWDGGNAVNQLLIYNGNSGNNGYGIVLNPFTLPDSNLGILCGGVAYLTTSTTFTIGVWHHVAAVRSAGIWKLYLDGVQLTLTNTGTVPNTPATTGTNMGQNSFAGTLDEIRVWNVARTESEIQTTMNQSLNGAETGLVAYWSVEEGTGPTTADITVNGNDGTINGATWVSSITALPAGPSATTSNASNIGVGTARANGIVYANNASTTVRFVYGTISGTYTDSVTATQSPVTGTTNTSVSKSLSGLSANTMYFFRVVASNTNGYVRGNELSFTTNNTGSSSGYALQFDGVDDYVEIGNASAFSVGSAVTYEAWINPSSTQLGWILNKWVDFIEDKQLLYSGNRVF